MKRIILPILCLFLAFLLSGCGTIYQAAVDERSVGIIVQDTKIKTKILKSFADDEQVKVLDFSVSCYQGHAYLIGEYETTAQKDRATRIARNTEGVKDVTTYFLQKQKNPPCTTKENLGITAKVKAKLIGDKGIWSTNIDVKTMQCIVVLWGLVGSQDETSKAVAHAKSVEGVKLVKTFLKTVQ